MSFGFHQWLCSEKQLSCVKMNSGFESEKYVRKISERLKYRGNHFKIQRKSLKIKLHSSYHLSIKVNLKKELAGLM